jgi:Lon protease-like protein
MSQHYWFVGTSISPALKSFGREMDYSPRSSKGTTHNETMAIEIIPLFPLSMVLLPSMPLPLHIFEDRYKEMMDEIIPAKGEFGVVFAKDDGIVNIGCTATVERVMRRYDDGRLDLLAIGQRRFRIESLDQDKSFLRAEVEFFNDDDATEVPLELRQRATAAYKDLATADEESSEATQPAWENTRISFQLARHIDDFDKRQTVLSLRSEIERLEFLVKVIPEYVAKRARVALAKRVAPLNGHAKVSH